MRFASLEESDVRIIRLIDLILQDLRIYAESRMPEITGIDEIELLELLDVEEALPHPRELALGAHLLHRPEFLARRLLHLQVRPEVPYLPLDHLPIAFVKENTQREDEWPSVLSSNSVQFFIPLKYDVLRATRAGAVRFDSVFMSQSN